MKPLSTVYLIHHTFFMYILCKLFCILSLSRHPTCLGLMYSPLESLIGHYRGKKDIGNSFAAAAITGALFKSTGETLQHHNINVQYIVHIMLVPLLCSVLGNICMLSQHVVNYIKLTISADWLKCVKFCSQTLAIC